MTASPTLELRGVDKSFGPVHVLSSVDFTANAGEITALVGDNGAGKSTLVKCIGGISPADAGELIFDGTPQSVRGPRDAALLGVEIVYQDLALSDNLDIVENMFLGREMLTRFHTLDENSMEKLAKQTLASLSVRTVRSVRQLVASLSGGQRQSVAIARAIHFNARILIMDEPTAALGPAETAQVRELVSQLKNEGIGIFLISHDIHDVFDLSDRVSVMYHGRIVDTVNKNDTTPDDVLGMIILGKKPGEVTEKELAALELRSADSTPTESAPGEPPPSEAGPSESAPSDSAPGS
jgi:D-xylose transport system ATP-binding protein